MIKKSVLLLMTQVMVFILAACGAEEASTAIEALAIKAIANT